MAAPQDRGSSKESLLTAQSSLVAAQDQGETADDLRDAGVDEDLDDAQALNDTSLTFAKKAFIAVAVVFMFFLSFMLGKYSMTPLEVCSVALGFIPKWFGYLGAAFPDPAAIMQVISLDVPMDTPERVLFKIRLPRILVVMLVGAALAIAGASYQGMFKNPLTSPDLLGASTGASFGACLALLLSLSGEYVQLFAFIGGMVAVGLAVWLNKMVDYDPTLGLVLAGILVSTLFQSGMSLIKLVADADDKLPSITFWLMGSFASINWADFLMCLLPMVFGFVLLVSQSWKLNVLSFGDEEARSMGVNTRLTRLVVIFASTLVTSISVAVAGVVGWIGLVIPHLARAIVGPNYKVLLPTSMFVGAAYLLIVDNMARLLASVEIPIGILTAILGVPFFIIIFRRNMKGWS